MVELIKELQFNFLNINLHCLTVKNNVWRAKRTYLANVFSHLNVTYLSIQRKETNIFRAQDNMISFSRKLQYQISEVELGNFDCFPLLAEFLQKSKIKLDAETLDKIKDYLNSLSTSLTEYFPNSEYKEYYWVQHPFTVIIQDI